MIHALKRRYWMPWTCLAGELDLELKFWIRVFNHICWAPTLCQKAKQIIIAIYSQFGRLKDIRNSSNNLEIKKILEMEFYFSVSSNIASVQYPKEHLSHAEDF